MDKLQRSIGHLRVLAPRLNQVTDDAARVVQRVEKFLNEECKIGVPAYYAVNEGFEGEVYRQIAYMRHGDRFRIVVRHFKYVTSSGELVHDRELQQPLVDNVEATAWSECPRGTKLETFPYLPFLLDEVRKEVETSIKNATEASAAIEDWMKAFDGPPEPPESPDLPGESKPDGPPQHPPQSPSGNGVNGHPSRMPKRRF